MDLAAFARGLRPRNPGGRTRKGGKAPLQEKKAPDAYR